jgi:acetoin utilization deacetylase AcuC-like enzyme
MIKSFAPDHLIVSAGMDTFDGDPLGTFKVTQNGISQIGAQIAALQLPTVIIMEGGYANEALGTNIVTLLENFK